MEFLKESRRFDFLYDGKNLSECEFSIAVSEDKNTVILCVYSKIPTVLAVDEYVKLYGLDEKATYNLNGKVYGGDYLMNKGYKLCNNVEYASKILVFTKTK